MEPFYVTLLILNVGDGYIIILIGPEKGLNGKVVAN